MGGTTRDPSSRPAPGGGSARRAWPPLRSDNGPVYQVHPARPASRVRDCVGQPASWGQPGRVLGSAFSAERHLQRRPSVGIGGAPAGRQIVRHHLATAYRGRSGHTGRNRGIDASEGLPEIDRGGLSGRGCGLLIYDLFPRNVVRSGDGTLYPIDPVIQRVTPDFADFLARHPERIHDRP